MRAWRRCTSIIAYSRLGSNLAHGRPGAHANIDGAGPGVVARTLPSKPSILADKSVGQESEEVGSSTQIAAGYRTEISLRPGDTTVLIPDPIAWHD